MSEIEVVVEHKSFNDVNAPVIKNLRFTANRGELIAIVGPSGAGKSTLLNILAGLDTNYDGEIKPSLTNGDSDKDAKQSKRLGYVFQQPRLMPWLTIEQNLKLVLNDSSTDAERICQLLADVGLEDKRNAYPNELSGGMQRRAALARAFSTEPEVLLLDEPFVSVDAPTANRLRDLLLELYERYAPTVIFVTHDLREALYLGDRILFMSKNPGTLAVEYTVETPRPRVTDSQEIDTERQRLLQHYPGLLEGELKPD